eukprot:PITA_36271
MNQPVATIPLPEPTLPALQQNPQSNLRPQLLAQPNPNPNNRPVQFVQIIETPELETDLKECNDLQLRSGRIIGTKGDKNVQFENQLPTEQPLQEEDVVRKQTHDQETTSSPPFPERLIIPRPIEHPDFDILGELKNLYIKIPLLQAIQDILVYANTIKELCIKKPRMRITNNPTVQVVGTLFDLLSGREAPIKYEDPRNPIVIVQINGQTFSNALVDLGAIINILTTTTFQKLGITSIEPTSTLLELADRSVVKPEDKCDRAFEDLKKLMSTAPVLRGPNWDLPFQISSDASDIAIGVVLGQEEDKKPYAIYYINENLSLSKLKCAWATRLLEALWAYRTTWRNTIGYSPYQLVFGKEPIFPIEFEIQTLRTTQEVGLDLNEAKINRLQQINMLNEIRLSAFQRTALIQQQRAKWHDALIKKEVFHEGYWALLYDSRFQDFSRKLQTRWLEPYEI